MSKVEDLTGQRFGELTVIRDSGERQNHKILWLCRCDCGNELKVTTGNLHQGVSTRCKSCGHKHAAITMLVDLRGKKFGRLVPIEVVGSDKYSKHIWKCKCDCGNTTYATTGLLTSGKTKSCGCYKQDEFKQRVTTHGMTNTRVYGIWQQMKDRCLNSKNPHFYCYGGRGITVCERWKNSFENFLSDMGNPNNDLSIDRIDPDGNYEPSNCRWATVYQQAHNKRNTIRVTIDGVTDTIDKWEELSPVRGHTIRKRLRQGYNARDAVFAVKFYGGKVVKYD